MEVHVESVAKDPTLYELGLAMRVGEESAFVNGVRLLTFRDAPAVETFGC